MRNSKTRRRSGFTLVEVLVVIAILGIIASIFIVRYVSKYEGAKVETAEFKLKELAQTIDAYYMTNNRYPESWEELVTPEEEGKKGVLYKTPYDPWDNEYLYEITEGEENPYTLKSLGPDGVESEDDIDYWVIMTTEKEDELNE